MADYQISARSTREIRVGQQEETVGTFHRGRWIQNMAGEIGGEGFKMKLPAPWRGMRYRLEQDGRELANAARPAVKRRMVTYDLEMPGRRLRLASTDADGLVYVLFEGGEELGRYTQRSFGEHDAWTGDFRGREASPALAAFVAWLVLEARPLHHS
ncbi:MAG TPA: hypothetical protein VMO26_00500 [Vicinamibacterales bacterium]|nr:hypothetical protein [Vicinamibacterales bacterium]